MQDKVEVQIICEIDTKDAKGRFKEKHMIRINHDDLINIIRMLGQFRKPILDLNITEIRHARYIRTMDNE